MRGGLYANNLTVEEGPGTVDGPVMAKRDIVISPAPENPPRRIVFKCGLSARLSVSVNVPTTFQFSPVNLEGFIPLFIQGDIIAPSVRLENAVVVGNIFATDATIKDSVVLGCALIENKLVFRNSMALSLRAGSIEMVGRNSLWVPYSLARADIEFTEDRPDEEDRVQRAYSEDQTKSAPPPADADRAWVRYLGLCSKPPHGCGKPDWFICHEHLAGRCPFPDVRMNERDKVNIRRGGARMVALTIAPRVVDLQSVQSDLQQMADLLTDFMYLGHYTEDSRARVMKALERQREANTFGELDAKYALLEHVARLALATGETPQA